MLPEPRPGELTEPLDSRMNGHLKPPTYGQAQREAVTAVVHQTTNEICSRARLLMEQLSEIEQVQLESAAKVKAMLNRHIEASGHAAEMIDRIAAEIADLRKMTEAP